MKSFFYPQGNAGILDVENMAGAPETTRALVLLVTMVTYATKHVSIFLEYIYSICLKLLHKKYLLSKGRKICFSIGLFYGKFDACRIYIFSKLIIYPTMQFVAVANGSEICNLHRKQLCFQFYLLNPLRALQHTRPTPDVFIKVT